MVFSWDNEKNERLKRERGVSFERIVFLIQHDFILDILERPSKERYRKQRLYIINIDNYAYVVPFFDEGNVRFLKTIFPSRKYTQIYLKKNGENNEA